MLKSKSPPATPRSGHTPTTRSDDAFPKNAKKNTPGRVPTPNAPASTGVANHVYEKINEYFQSAGKNQINVKYCKN